MQSSIGRQNYNASALGIPNLYLYLRYLDIHPIVLLYWLDVPVHSIPMSSTKMYQFRRSPTAWNLPNPPTLLLWAMSPWDPFLALSPNVSVSGIPPPTSLVSKTDNVMHFVHLVKQASVDLASRPICVFRAYITLQYNPYSLTLKASVRKIFK